MGFLYDAVGHWHEFERSPVEVLWNRRTEDLVHNNWIHGDRAGFKMDGDMPCVTIWGRTSVGCGRFGRLTYEDYKSEQRAQVVRSGGVEVGYCMSEPKSLSFA